MFNKGDNEFDLGVVVVFVYGEDGKFLMMISVFGMFSWFNVFLIECLVVFLIYVVKVIGV